jgi:GGDEF domain-containing protein
VFPPGQAADDAGDTPGRLCEAVRAEPFAPPGGGRRNVTVSVGGAWGVSTPVEVPIRVDAALHAAKHAGRDRCRFATERPAQADGLASATETACPDCSLR